MSKHNVYFEKKFNETSQHLSHDTLIEIPDIDKVILNNLIDYMYTGTLVRIRKNNVEKLLKGAKILQLYDVQDLCVEFLQKSINSENWLEIKSIADSRMITNLSDRCFEWALKHFYEICRSAEFMNFDIEQIKFLIKRDDLYVAVEDHVYDAVILWVKHDEINRKPFVPELMTLVRVPYMNYIYLHKILEEEPLITSNLICFEYLTKMHKELFYKHKEAPYQHIKPRCTETYLMASSLPCLRCYAANNAIDKNDSSPKLDKKKMSK